MDHKNCLSLDIDFNEIKSHADYKKVWETFSPVKVKMVEKNERIVRFGRNTDRPI